MNINEIVKLIYEDYHKLVLNTYETAKVCGLSYSRFSKYFGGKDAIDEKNIINEDILPKWFMFGKRRMWKVEEVAKWLANKDIVDQLKIKG